MKISRPSAVPCAAVLAALFVSQAAAAQSPPEQRPAPLVAWTPKKAPSKPWAEPNRPWWKLADVRALHEGEENWTQPVIRNKDLVADWHQLSPQGKTPTIAYSDNRTAIIVWEGELRVSMEGHEPFTARKGFEINVPLRVPFTLESVGSEPALYFQLNAASDMRLYPVETTPAKPEDIAGWEYEQRLIPGRPGGFDEKHRPYLDYYGDVVNGNDRAGAFIADQHMFVNNIRGRATPTPPASNLGHFHIGYDEFWFVMEGNVTLQVEGQPVFTAAAGDIISAPQGHWHRASFGGPVGQMGTRVAINPYPQGAHVYTQESGGRQ
ncbi:cupin domain-containing protein [Altererythrobacter sp. C41]|uniref:cupin domain-containing protein n=1 Tax=Altererythrobacter sp. C41 TaxID=2806021 RepID=UPI0019336A6E|nr:cupin domain-containing protein [Altererythrobacter sp. C41]MBM0170487.1 cupin domain-containing protein [Altererythrobacter sp. C41]